jgi:hypothetical protein
LCNSVLELSEHLKVGRVFRQQEQLVTGQANELAYDLAAWLPRLSMMRCFPRRNVGSTTFSKSVAKLSLSIGPSSRHGAEIQSSRSATRNVIVFQRPAGTLPIKRLPRGA